MGLQFIILFLISQLSTTKCSGMKIKCWLGKWLNKLNVDISQTVNTLHICSSKIGLMVIQTILIKEATLTAFTKK